jgi:hypothetical protein
VVIVSGLAYGIDAAAHEGALAAGGATVAILASGLDRPSPIGNRRLARRILAQGGAWLSEYPPGESARPFHFPERNRLIIGSWNRSVFLATAKDRQDPTQVIVFKGDFSYLVSIRADSWRRESAVSCLRPAYAETADEAEGGQMAKLTKAYIDKLAPDANRDRLVWDEHVPGFGIRVSQGGERGRPVEAVHPGSAWGPDALRGSSEGP